MPYRSSLITPPAPSICTTREATMSINALPSFTPQILNAQGINPCAAVMPLLPQGPGNPMLAGIQQFSQLMQPKDDSDESETDEASL
jgi:hypothetical protein